MAVLSAFRATLRRSGNTTTFVRDGYANVRACVGSLKSEWGQLETDTRAIIRREVIERLSELRTKRATPWTQEDLDAWQLLLSLSVFAPKVAA